MPKVIKEIPFGGHTLRLETGEIARQATAAVLVSWQETVVLVTVVVAKKAKEDRDFFPLTVNYQERTYAAGRIPGGFLKREGRPSERETLNARLIDRPLRPLFPKSFRNDVQVVATVLSYNPEVNPDILALIGASAALTIARVPFDGPVGAARVGYQNGTYLLNPTETQLADSALDLVVSGTKDAILMVESEAKELSEEVMLGAVMFGHESMQPVITLIEEMATDVGNTTWEYAPAVIDESLEQRVRELAAAEVARAFSLQDKTERSEALSQLHQSVAAEILSNDESANEKTIHTIISDLERNYVRQRVLSGEPRIDGRDNKTVRPIAINTGILPRTHGSAIFTRGETQAIVVLTLGSERDAQLIDAAVGESKQQYMLHYNFPPYCVGETGMMGSPKRREIGHGNLARRATLAVMPSQEDFPYVMRLVSEITESNGSSSMATVCGATLAMMDAGVPIKAPVAGIAMGLIKEGDQHAVLTDILGDEDHLGDMDFKVAGTANGVTALQMDIKITGITREIMETALAQANVGRQHILDVMDNALDKPRQVISPYAPRYHYMKINPNKIRDVIGKGGVTIRAITEETGVTVDLEDDGTVKLFSPDQPSVDRAIELIEEIVKEIEAGVIYEGAKVSKVVDFGAFIDVGGGREGLLHISQISHERINNVSDVLKEGQIVTVKCLAVEPNGRVKFSMKALQEERAPSQTEERSE